MAEPEIKSIHPKRIQTKHTRAKAHLKVFYSWFRALVGSILFLGLASAAGSIIFFAWVAEEVLEGDMRMFDETVRNFIHGLANDWLTFLMKFITNITTILYIICLNSKRHLLMTF